MVKKYEITDETIVIDCHILHRIKALTKFGWVKKGDLGGWIEKEENLSQYCKCWISGDAKVYGDAKVFGNAQVYGNVMVFGSAKIFDDARVYGDATVCSNAQVFGNALICDTANVFDNVQVSGHAIIEGNSHLYYETINTIKQNVNDAHDLLFEKIGIITEHHYSLIESDAITRMISDKNMTKCEMENNFKRIVSHNSNDTDNDNEYEDWLETLSV